MWTRFQFYIVKTQRVLPKQSFQYEMRCFDNQRKMIIFGKRNLNLYSHVAATKHFSRTLWECGAATKHFLHFRFQKISSSSACSFSRTLRECGAAKQSFAGAGYRPLLSQNIFSGKHLSFPEGKSKGAVTCTCRKMN